MKNSKDVLSINLKYYRYKANLSQEKFAEAINTGPAYENQLENGRRNVSINMLDKISRNISKILGYQISSADLITYDESKIIYSKRIDGRKGNQ